MAFWEDLQKGVTEAASYTAKKTSELTGIAKMKFNLHSEELKLEKCFTKIGSLFYTSEREGVDNTAEIAALIMQADKIKASVNSYREQLSKLRNSSICPGCGAEIAEDSVFCHVCGLKQEKNERSFEESCECEDDSCECGCGFSGVDEDSQDNEDINE